MSNDDLIRLDATAQAELVRSRELSARDLVDAAISRIERLNPRLGAVILPAFERARAAATRLDNERARLDSLPFAGVPILMKDLGGEEAGAPCHRGMRFLKEANWIEPHDSYFAERMQAAGFLSLGRTNTPELGLLPTCEPQAYGPTRNPWNLEHSPGGSSGGAAAAVASGMVPLAHASDGGGSIRIPAAHCGLVGLKPTRGRSSFGPNSGERWGGFSCELVVSRTVRDTAGALDATNGPMPGDPYSATPPPARYRDLIAKAAGPLRIGFVATARPEMELHPECAAGLARAVQALSDLGHTVEESFPAALADPQNVLAFITVVSCCTARALDTTAIKVGRRISAADVEPVTWAVAEMGRGYSVGEYLGAIDTCHSLGRRMAAWWEQGFDLLLTPTTARPAPRLGELVSPPDQPFLAFMRSAPFGVFTSVFNQTGQPAISLPLHSTADGLPIGVQLVAPYGREDLLLQVAAQIEAACPWVDNIPPVHA